MARFPESVLLKLPEGMLARIDAVSDNRSEFIRKAVILALTGREPLVKVSGDVPAESAPVLVEKAKEVRKPPARPVAPRVFPSKRSGGIGFDERMAGLSARLGAGRASDCRVVVEALRECRMSERDLERALGWVGIRCQNAVMALMGAGVVSMESGLLGVLDG